MGGDDHGMAGGMPGLQGHPFPLMFPHGPLNFNLATQGLANPSIFGVGQDGGRPPPLSEDEVLFPSQFSPFLRSQS